MRERLVESDPGLLRFRQAAKSVAAVAIAVGFFSSAGVVVSLFGAISAAFLMQCTDTGSAMRQKVSMAATALVLMILTPLGAALHGRRLAEAALLVAWAAAVFYARRFLQGNGGFTLFTFTIVLLATALPGSPQMQFLTAAGGFAIAYVLRFHVWPADEGRALLDAVRIFRAHARRIMDGDDARSHLEGVRAAVTFAHNLLTEHPELEPGYGRIVELFYEALQSLRMLREARVRSAADEGQSDCDRVHESIQELALCRVAETGRAFEAAGR